MKNNRVKLKNTKRLSEIALGVAIKILLRANVRWFDTGIVCSRTRKTLNEGARVSSVICNTVLSCAHVMSLMDDEAVL